MKVRATELGFFNGNRVRPGAIFEIPNTMKMPKWAEPASNPAPEVEQSGNKPVALSELAKVTAEADAKAKAKSAGKVTAEADAKA